MLSWIGFIYHHDHHHDFDYSQQIFVLTPQHSSLPQQLFLPELF